MLSALLPLSIVKDQELARPWVKLESNFFWLSRSAWSLYLIAKFRVRTTGNNRIVVWCPDYFCNSSLAPLRELGVKLKFYQIKEDGNPNIASCMDLISCGKPDLIIAVHYFGKPAELSGLINISSELGAWLIEDAAHVALPVAEIGTYGDFVLYSPHKSLPIPDGALLVVRDQGPCKITQEMINRVGLRCLYRGLTNYKGTNILRVIVWIIKRIIQKLRLHNIYIKSSFFKDETVLNTKCFTSPRMSLFSKNMLASMLKKIDDDLNKKITNQKCWAEYIIKNIVGYSVDANIVNEYIPYLFVLLHIDKKSAEKTFSKLLNNRLPVSTWPDLPPEVIHYANDHKVAITLRERRVFLPLHIPISYGLK